MVGWLVVGSVLWYMNYYRLFNAKSCLYIYIYIYIYNTEQSDGEVPAILELCRMRSTPLLPLLPNSLWPGMVAPNMALSMG